MQQDVSEFECSDCGADIEEGVSACMNCGATVKNERELPMVDAFSPGARTPGPLLLSMLALICLCQPASAQWVRMGGPEGGSVVALAATRNSILAAVHHAGVCRSTDGGSTWSRMNIPRQRYGFAFALAVADSCAFYAAGGGVLRSCDDGVTWTRADSLMGQTPFALLMSDTRVFGVTGSEVFSSTDNGQHWTTHPRPDQSFPLRCATMLGKQLVVGGRGLYFSSDNGVNLLQDSSRLMKYASLTALVALDSATLIAALEGGRLYRSTDGARTWDTLASSMNERITALAASPPTMPTRLLYVGTSGGNLYVSANRGLSWGHIGLPQTKGSIHCVLEMRDKLLVGTSGSGIFCSSHMGRSWKAQNAGLHGIGVTSLIALPGDPQADGTRTTALYGGSSGGLFLSTDEGKEWTVLGMAGTSAKILTDGHSLFAMCYSSGVFRSDDRGKNWIAITPPTRTDPPEKHMPRRGWKPWAPPQPSYLTALTTMDRMLMAGMSNGDIFLSYDKGQHWLDTEIPSTKGSVTSISAYRPAQFAVTGSGGFLRSTDGGKKWEQVTAGSKDSRFERILVSDTLFLAVTSNKELYFSSDAGATWHDANPDLPIADRRREEVVNFETFDKYLLCTIRERTRDPGSGSTKTFRSTNSGVTWSLADSSWGWLGSNSVIVNGETVFTPAYDGVWSCPLSELLK